MKELKNNLRSFRKVKGLNQTELAEIVGCTQGRIAEYETGKLDISNMKLSTALRFANALECSIDDLFTRKNTNSYTYGIFEANWEFSAKISELEKSRLSENNLWLVVNNDENIGHPIEVFNNKEDALKTLMKYRSKEYIYDRYGASGKILKYKVYFVAELNLCNEERPDDIEMYTAGDGLEVAPLPKRSYVVYDEHLNEVFRSETKEEAERFIENAERESDKNNEFCEDFKICEENN